MVADNWIDQFFVLFLFMAKALATCGTGLIVGANNK